MNKVRGMTLIEVMVALFIFAVAGSAMIKAAGDHLDGVGQIEEVTFATWVANNRLAQLQMTDQWPPKNNQKGSQDMSDRTWYWQQQVLKTNDDDLLSIEVTVGLSDQSGDSIVTVTGFVANPEPTF